MVHGGLESMLLQANLTINEMNTFTLALNVYILLGSLIEDKFHVMFIHPSYIFS